MAEHWRWADPNGQQRKIRTDELRAALAGGVIAPNTPVWRPGWSGWIAAHDVPELTSSALAAANGVVPNIPPPPLEVVAVQTAFEAQAGGQESVVDLDPPPPPHYVPAPTRGNGLVPPAPTSSSRNLGALATPAPVPAQSEITRPSASRVTTALQGSAHFVQAAPAAPAAAAPADGDITVPGVPNLAGLTPSGGVPTLGGVTPPPATGVRAFTPAPPTPANATPASLPNSPTAPSKAPPGRPRRAPRRPTACPRPDAATRG